MFSAGINFWFPITIVLSVISAAIGIIMFEKIQEKFLRLNNNEIILGPIGDNKARNGKQKNRPFEIKINTKSKDDSLI
jgi:hypothetical protein